MYAIRRKSDGAWFLQSTRREAITHQEPSTKGVPRLFGRLQFAKNALAQWLQGERTDEIVYIDGGDDWFYRKKITRKTNRRAEDFEIVKVALVIEDYL